MIVLSPTQFLKARATKYLKKWRGSDGEWWYKYYEPKGRTKKIDSDTKSNKVFDEKIETGYSTTPFTLFSKSRDQMTPSKFKAFVTRYTPEEYKAKGAKTYLSRTGLSGFAITKEGDLISVFSAEGAHEGGNAIKAALEMGAKTLDCLGPGLVSIYEKFGFKVKEVIPWDDKYAPPDWNYKEHGTPSVYMMKYTGGKDLKKSKDEMTPAFEKLSREYAEHLFGPDVEV